MKCEDFTEKTAYEAVELAEQNNIKLDQISLNRVSIEDIKEVYFMLKERVIHPAGNFDKGGRWWAEHDDLISVRTPSRSFPFSQMTACRTLKYVKAVAEKFKPATKEELIKLV